MLHAQGARRQPPAPATPVAAQPADTGARGGATISGFIVDSLRNRPLAGATVVIQGTTHSATTDDGGRFHLSIDGLADGQYHIGFFHPMLDSLGISPPTKTVTVKGGASQYVVLAVPSVNTIVRAVCPDSALSGGRGLVMGVVRDAETDRPLSGVRVVLMWTGVNVGNTAVVKVPQATSVLTARDGSYHVCGIPGDTRVTSQARAPGRSSGWIEVGVSAGGLALRDFLIGERRPAVAQAPAAGAAADTAGGAARQAPAAAPLGSARLSGTVTAADGKPLEGALVLLLGTQLTTRSNDQGQFRMGGLPAGTQSVEFREVGYSPKRYAVDLSPQRESKLTAVLDEHATVLKAIEVTARKGSGIAGFDERKKNGFGTYLTREDIEKRGSINMTDLFRQIPGVQVIWDGSEYLVQMARSAALGTSCPVQWYIDGSPFLVSGDDMDQVLRPEDIEAIEVYKSGTDTPVQFQSAGNSACGTIVVWTRRGGARKK